MKMLPESWKRFGRWPCTDDPPSPTSSKVQVRWYNNKRLFHSQRFSCYFICTSLGYVEQQTSVSNDLKCKIRSRDFQKVHK